MSINKNLAIAALAGLLSAGAMTASVAFAGEHEKSGCKGKAGAEKANCKTHCARKFLCHCLQTG